MSLFQLTLAVRGRLVFARNQAERRRIVREIARLGEGRLLLFCLVDEHLHTVLGGLRIGYLGRDLRRLLARLQPGVEVARPHVQLVDSRAYLRRLVDYVLRQPAKHGLSDQPALWTGSCFQDLAGARLLPGFDPGLLARELPRLRLREVFATVGLTPLALQPACDEELRRAGAARLIDLAAGVHAVGPELTGRSRKVVATRALAARAAAIAGLPTSEVAHHLGLGSHAVRKLARRDVDPRATTALRRRLTLEERATHQHCAVRPAG